MTIEPLVCSVIVDCKGNEEGTTMKLGQRRDAAAPRDTIAPCASGSGM